MSSQSRPYHHGDLPQALAAAALAIIDEAGPSAMSLREAARRTGVSHAAAAYHFGDKAGLLTAVAADGYRRLAAALADAQRVHGSFLEVGVAYVEFAVSHRAHFEVMYRPDLYRPDAADVSAARAEAARLLYGTEHADAGQLVDGVAAWSLVHGLATLWLGGNLPRRLGDDPQEITRAVAARLQPARRETARRSSTGDPPSDSPPS